MIDTTELAYESGLSHTCFSRVVQQLAMLYRHVSSISESLSSKPGRQKCQSSTWSTFFSKKQKMSSDQYTLDNGLATDLGMAPCCSPVLHYCIYEDNKIAGICFHALTRLRQRVLLHRLPCHHRVDSLITLPLGGLWKHAVWRSLFQGPACIFSNSHSNGLSEHWPV